MRISYISCSHLKSYLLSGILRFLSSYLVFTFFTLSDTYIDVSLTLSVYSPSGASWFIIFSLNLFSFHISGLMKIAYWFSVGRGDWPDISHVIMISLRNESICYCFCSSDIWSFIFTVMQGTDGVACNLRLSVCVITSTRECIKSFVECEDPWCTIET